MEYGIDVSNHQGSVNWSRVASDGITFAHAKASEGTYYRDPYFEQNRKGARAYGIHFGGYHFAQPDKSTAKAEANFFFNVAGRPQAGDVRQVLDLEVGHGALTAWAGLFLAELERLTGVRPMIYTGPWFISGHLNLKALAGYARWIADYGANDGRVHSTSVSNVEHQFTSNASVKGVVGRVDKNCAPALGAILVPAKHVPSPVGPEARPEPKNGSPFTRLVWPVPLPAWFWVWAQWRLDGQTYARPLDAPIVVPPWAWARLKGL